LLTQPVPLLFFSGLVALWALPSTLPQTEGTFWTALGFSAALGLSVSSESATAEASGAGVSAEAGPFAAALGEGPGLVAKEGKLFSSRLGGACNRWHALILLKLILITMIVIVIIIIIIINTTIRFPAHAELGTCRML